MKKVIVILLIVFNLILSTIYITQIIKNSNLSEDDKQYIEKINELKKEQKEVQSLVDNKNSELVNINKSIEDKKKIESGTAKYIMKINIAQSHVTLSISEHLKDQMNDINIYIEVSEEFYNKYQIGDTIADDFRIGSMIFKGSFGNWKVKVSDKQII